MRRRALVATRPVSLLIVALATALLTAAQPAGAATSVESGWWTAAPVPAAPDAPADALVVQGGVAPDDPISYAVVSYSLASDEVPQSVTLTVAQRSASTPNAKLMLCPAPDAFIPVQGGGMDSAPRYDCSTNATGTRSHDGSAYEFDVSGFVAVGLLAVAVLPTALTDRVVFARPGPESLQSITRPAPTGTASPSSSETSSDDVISDSRGGAIPAAGDPFNIGGPTGSSPGALVSGSETPLSSVEDARLALPTSAGSRADGDGDSPVPWLVFGGLLLLAAVLWTSASSSRGTTSTTT